MTVPANTARPPGVLGALAFAADLADELVVDTVREVHGAVTARVSGAELRLTRGASRLPRAVHNGIAATAYLGVRAGLRATAQVMRVADRRGVGTRLDATPLGQHAVAAANGFFGDRLASERSELAIEPAIRVHGRDVRLDRESVAAAFPDAGPDLVFFLHGLAEYDGSWERRHERCAGGYAERLERDLGWIPVLLRMNTGLPIAENGRALADLVGRLVAVWPQRPRRLALVGHSMGGLVVRSACAVDPFASWTQLVTDVVTLGTPHLGAPLERLVAGGAGLLGVLPESAPFGRLLGHRSAGILDLAHGLSREVAPLPHAQYHLVAATLSGSRRDPVGDLFVRYPSAVGRNRRHGELFPGSDVLHVTGNHFDLLNHPEVYAALRSWLAAGPAKGTAA